MSAENKFGAATANVLDSVTLRPALTWDTAKHVEVVRRAGLDGVELWPQRIRPFREIEHGLDEDVVSGVISAHQSFRPDSIKTIRDAGTAVFLPGIQDSLRYLEMINSATGGIPVVFYKETPQEFLGNTAIPVKQIQTDPSACIDWGATNANEFLDEAAKRGFTDQSGNPAIVNDTHHIRHDHDTGVVNPLADWQESLPVMMPYITEVHLGVGRIDYGTMESEVIREELLDLLNGGEKNTEVVRMLRYMAEAGWNGPVIIEMRPSAVKEVIGSMSENDIVSTYTRLRETLFRIFGN